MSDRQAEASAIDAALRDRLEGLLDALCPGWVKRGGKAYLAPVSAKKLSSWQADLAGPNRGRWWRFSQKRGGGPMQLIAYVRSGETGTRPTKGDFDWARDFLGWTQFAPAAAESETARRRRESRASADAHEARTARDRAIQRTADLIAACRPIPGTPTARYLASRAIVFADLPAMPAGLYHHASLAYFADPLPSSSSSPASGRRRPRKVHAGPAMVAAMTAPDGAVTGAHITWLAPDGSDKAEIIDPETGEVLVARKMRGIAGQGCVRLTPSAPAMVLAEGIETTLSIMMGLGMAGWAALSLGNLDAPLPETVKTVWLGLDSDERDYEAACRTQEGAVVAHSVAGRTVKVLKAPRGMDWNDVVRQEATREGALVDG